MKVTIESDSLPNLGYCTWIAQRELASMEHGGLPERNEDMEVPHCGRVVIEVEE